jgi:hypothetical protein
LIKTSLSGCARHPMEVCPSWNSAGLLPDSLTELQSQTLQRIFEVCQRPSNYVVGVIARQVSKSRIALLRAKKIFRKNIIPFGQKILRKNIIPFGQKILRKNIIPFGQKIFRKNIVPFGQKIFRASIFPLFRTKNYLGKILSHSDKKLFRKNIVPFRQKIFRKNIIPFGQKIFRKNIIPFGQKIFRASIFPLFRTKNI